MGYHLGIDIGTTFTSAAVSVRARPTMLGLGNRALQIPSVLFLTPGGEFLVGEVAERRGVVQPDRLVREFKRRVGDQVPILVAGSPHSAQALMARLLSWVVAAATERQGVPPDGVVATHPANWGPYKRDLFLQALRLADLDRTAILTEPEAAAMLYATRNDLTEGECIAVYDLGGGTFDAAVLRRMADGFEVIGTPEGIEQLGGIDFDEAVFQHVIGGIRDHVDSLSHDQADVRLALARLRRDCVDAKEALSTDTEASVSIALPGIHTLVRLDRTEFEAMIHPTITDTVGAMRRALRSAGITAGDLSMIVLIGGSSRIPLVQRLLRSEFDRPLALDTHPKHDVALGATLASDRIVREPPTSRRQPADDRPRPTTVGVSPPKEVSHTVGATRSGKTSSEPEPHFPSAAHLGAPSEAVDAESDQQPRERVGGRPSKRVLAAALATSVVIAGVAYASTLGSDGTQGAPGGTSETPLGGTGTPTVTTSAAPGLPMAAAPLPDQQIMANVRTPTGSTFVRIDISGAVTVIRSAEARDSHPSLSPDRRTISYFRIDEATGVPTVRVMAADDGAGDAELFTAPDTPCAHGRRPAWNADGSRLAVSCMSDVGESLGLFVLEPDGTEVRKLTDDAAGSPTWTSGGLIIFTLSTDDSLVDEETGGRLWTIDPAGGTPTPLPTAAGSTDSHPAWSPETQMLLFLRATAGRSDVYVAGPDGSSPRPLTQVGNARSPAWSPDGETVAFISAGADGVEGIWLVDAAGGDPRPLPAELGGELRHLAWDSR